MYSLGSYETNAPHLCFFHKESIDVAPLKFKNAMCLSNLFLYKATITVRMEASGQGGRRFYSRREQFTAFEGGDGWRASTYSFCMQGGDGWRAGTRGEGGAGTKYI
jgi:hypothetical protein